MSGDASVPEFLSQHQAGDTWCNDGWRIFSNGSKVTFLTRQAQSRKLLFDFWCGRWWRHLSTVLESSP